jgi:hypothetical protein
MLTARRPFSVFYRGQERDFPYPVGQNINFFSPYKGLC